VACPKDMTMYTDAAKTTGNEESMAVLDVVQLLDAAIDRDALAARRPAPAPEPTPGPAEPAAEAAAATSAVAVLERPEAAPTDPGETAPAQDATVEPEVTVDLTEPVEAAVETEAPPEG
jgi:hypothetical protein